MTTCEVYQRTVNSKPGRSHREHPFGAVLIADGKRAEFDMNVPIYERQIDMKNDMHFPKWPAFS
jgi:hypothetical protein